MVILNTGTFIGKFHPVVVHLPIGFLLLAVFLEIYSRRTRNKNMDPAISFSLFLGFLSGIISVILGFLISGEGGYDSSILTGHKIAGLMVTIFALACWSLKSGKLKLSVNIYPGLSGLLVISLLLTGHLGGMLTHGNNFLLSSAPGFIKKIFRVEKKNPITELHAVPDSVYVFAHLIQPVLEKKCLDCHNSSKKKSGLELNSYSGIIKGGQGGHIIQAGNPLESQLFRRITLPTGDPEFMPPNGEHMSYGEIQLLRWWIEKGAAENMSLGDTELPEEIKRVLLTEYDYNASPKSFLEIKEVQAAGNDIIQALERNGFAVFPIAEKSNFLDLKLDRDSTGPVNLNVLSEVREQVAWLDLRNCGISDSMIHTLSGLSNLTRLRLDGNPVTDAGIGSLENLEHLEIISLYGTEVGNEGLHMLLKHPYLKKIYVGQTRVEPDEIIRLRNSESDVQIIGDLNFAENTN